MTGQPATVIFAMSFFVFFLYAAKRTFALPSVSKQKVEAEMIARKEIIHGRERTRNAVLFYFRGLFKSLAIVLFCVFISAVNFLFMLLTIRTGGTPSPLWLVILVVFVLFLFPFSVIALKTVEAKALKDTILEDRFSD